MWSGRGSSWDEVDKIMRMALAEQETATGSADEEESILTIDQDPDVALHADSFFESAAAESGIHDSDPMDCEEELPATSVPPARAEVAGTSVATAAANLSLKSYSDRVTEDMIERAIAARNARLPIKGKNVQWSIPQAVLKQRIRDLDFFKDKVVEHAIRKLLLRPPALNSLTRSVRLVAMVFWSESELRSRQWAFVRTINLFNDGLGEIDPTGVARCVDLHQLLMRLHNVTTLQQWQDDGMARSLPNKVSANKKATRTLIPAISSYANLIAFIRSRNPYSVNKDGIR